MILWRISRYRDLRGLGGLRAAGRWHYAGQAVVYLSESPAAALLEVCVHTCANDVPPDFTLLKIEGPDLEPDVVALNDLPADWMTRKAVVKGGCRKHEVRVRIAYVPFSARFPSGAAI